MADDKSNEKKTSCSVIICSRNREKQLAVCLERLPADSFVQYAVELILVDSASEDYTWKLMEAHAEKVSYSVKCLRVSEPGLALARNKGIETTQSDLLVFTDDDCYIQHNYLSQLLRYFNKEDYQFCGGRILLWDKGDAELSVNYKEEFFHIPSYSFLPAGIIQGANMVIHRSVFDKIGGFNVNLGAGTSMRCEDIELLGRASMNGFAGAYLPQLVVYHHHKRKAGIEAQQIREANDIARGAYYACMADQGFVNYWYEGMKQALTTDPGFGRNAAQCLANELSGAKNYFELKAMGKLKV